MFCQTCQNKYCPDESKSNLASSLLEKDFQRLHDANKGEATDPRR
jgi:hypothetical protein